MKRYGFTLAEVLITLGVIGVVSAITIPTLIQSYRNHVVETRLKKVYSVMNQAIQRAEADYGAKELWDIYSPDFYDKYYAPYIKVLKTDIIDSTTWRRIYFPDGSLLLMSEYNHKDYVFYPNANNFDNINKLNDDAGSKSFLFLLNPVDKYDTERYAHFTKNKGFEPYAYDLSKDLSNLLSGNRHSCNKDALNRGFCTYYIYINGWKIPKNYPFKVK